jgi:hypothetical protein
MLVRLIVISTTVTIILIVIVITTRGGAREGLAGAPAPARNFFSSPSLNNIYNFSLSNKAIKILAPLNFIFYFRH